MTVRRELSVVRLRDSVDDARPTAAPSHAHDRLQALEMMSDVAMRVASNVDLPGTLAAIATAVVDSLGFGAAVLNLVRGTHVDVVAIAGPPEVEEALNGSSQPLQIWEKLLDRSRPLGMLRFVDGRADGGDLEGLLCWVPDIEANDDPESWHPQDALFAPLTNEDGEMIGVLSVDLPHDGCRPGAATLELLERFAAMAALAIGRAQMHQRIADSAALFQRAFEDAPLAMALLDLDGRIVRTNSKYVELLQRTALDLLGVYCWDVVHADHREQVRAALRQVSEGVVPVAEGDVPDVDSNRWLRSTTSLITGPTGPRVLVQMFDITEQRCATEILHAQATTDPLTGLSNRTGLLRHLNTLLDNRRRSGDGDVAVLYCDLDMFKLVNDTHGHAAGDAMLVHVARALRHEMRETDQAARFGGDEFVVVLDPCGGVEGAVVAAERMMRAVAQRLDVDTATLTSSMSVGIALATPTADAEQLLASADAALYRAKANGRGCWQLAG